MSVKKRDKAMRAQVEQIAADLDRWRAGAVCHYIGPRCDCKYGKGVPDPSYGEQTGCPELRDFVRRLLLVADPDRETRAETIVRQASISENL